jgi:uncharacterized protein YyaL (SSP411 family)
MNLPARYWLIPFFALTTALSSHAVTAAGLTNQLKNHPSPYLALHGSDPVAWQKWNARAVQAARRDNRLLFVSIGYFSCHWCHVMQRESYKNPEIANYLNKHFVAVKVDRELEPALDARLIAFAEKTQGVSGWPLNVFLTPDGYPLYAVMYLPPAEFKGVLTRLQQLWQQDSEGLKRVALKEAGGGKGPGSPDLSAAAVKTYIDKVIETSLQIGDPFNGGFGEQSKFPSVPQLDFLVQQYQRQPDPRLKTLLTRTLDNMMHYGLHDHLCGGFFRYTVDPGWRTPHFEKMLYDNALMARLYLRAGQLMGREDYTRVAKQTLDFMSQVMRRPGGGFIAALSAIDSNNIEGGYYLWQPDELKKRLTADELKIYLPLRGMTDAPAFEDGHLPIADKTVPEVAGMTGLSTEKVAALLASADRKLLAARATRSLPADSKLLAGWNGLALSAYAEAARLRLDPGYAGIASGIRNYLVRHLWDGKQLRRSVVAGRAIGQASLEDYAQVASGLLDYARLTGRTDDFDTVRSVVNVGWQRFYGNTGWRLSKTSLMQPEAGQDAIADGPMPSPSGSLMATTIELAGHLGDEALRQQALAALNSGHDAIASDPFWYVGHVAAMSEAIGGGRREAVR